MLKKMFLCGGLLTIAAGTSFQIVVALLVQFFYILLIERVMPYKHLHDDVVQLGSVQLFLTLVAGLALKLLEHSTVEKIDSAEKDQLGVVLVVLNGFIFVASAGALYLATEGKRDFINQSNAGCAKNTERARSNTKKHWK